MKIVIVTSPFAELPPDAIGAIERRWFNSAAEFVKLGHSVQLIGKRGRTELPNEEQLHRTYIKGYARTKSIFLDIILDFFYSFRTLRRVDVCDCLVINTFWGPILAQFLAPRKYKKLVYNVARFPKRHMRLYRAVNLFICTSSPIKKALIEVAPKLVNYQVDVVNNPIDVRVFKESYDGVSKRPCLIGYHGRVNKEKGLDLLAKAVAILAKEFTDVKIRVIGSWEVGKGGSGLEYKKSLDRLSGDRIEWVDAISDREKLANSLRECSCYCYPSVAEKGETFGVAPLEAMGLGLSVIVSKLECFGDFLKDGESGMVFDHRAKDSFEQLASLIRCLLQDESLREKLGKAASERAMLFSTERTAFKYLSSFENILKD